MVFHYSSLKHFVTRTGITHLWIYAWDSSESGSCNLYALPVINNCSPISTLDDLQEPSVPIAIQLDLSAYNHLVFVTRNRELAQRAVEILYGCGLLEKSRSYFGS